MATRTIRLTTPLRFEGGSFNELELRDIEAGDLFDAGRDAEEGASVTEIEGRIAAICSDVPFAAIRRLSYADWLQVQGWFQDQQRAAIGTSAVAASDAGDEDGGEDGAAENPSPTG